MGKNKKKNRNLLENFLDPEIFCNQSDSSVIKNV